MRSDQINPTRIHNNKMHKIVNETRLDDYYVLHSFTCSVILNYGNDSIHITTKCKCIDVLELGIIHFVCHFFSSILFSCSLVHSVSHLGLSTQSFSQIHNFIVRDSFEENQNSNWNFCTWNICHFSSLLFYSKLR